MNSLNFEQQRKRSSWKNICGVGTIDTDAIEYGMVKFIADSISSNYKMTSLEALFFYRQIQRGNNNIMTTSDFKP